MAQAILANLLASAQATTLECRRVSRLRIQTPSRLLKYLPAEAAFLRLRGSRCTLYRIVQFQREFHACLAV